LDWPPGRIPNDAESEQFLREFEHSDRLSFFPADVDARRRQELRHLLDQGMRLWPTVRIPEDIGSAESLTAFLSRRNTILGVGDSFTVGLGVRYEDTYLRRLEKRLAQDGEPVNIKISAYPGNDLIEVCDTYTLESAAQHYPLVIYGFVLNDFGLPGGDSIIGMDYIDIYSAESEYNAWRSHFATLNLVCHAVEKIRIDRMTRQCYLNAFRGDNAQKHFKRLADLHRQAETNGARLVIVVFPLLYDLHDYPFQEIHSTIGEFCRAEGIPLLDLLPAFSEHPAQELWVHPIDHHPNEIAHEIAAREIHAFLSCGEFLDTLTALESPSVRPSDATDSDGVTDRLHSVIPQVGK
jgi:lysophospholipase L1-like esterase